MRANERRKPKTKPKQMSVIVDHRQEADDEEDQEESNELDQCDAWRHDGLPVLYEFDEQASYYAKL